MGKGVWHYVGWGWVPYVVGEVPVDCYICWVDHLYVWKISKLISVASHSHTTGMFSGVLALEA